MVFLVSSLRRHQPRKTISLPAHSAPVHTSVLAERKTSTISLGVNERSRCRFPGYGNLLETQTTCLDIWAIVETPLAHARSYQQSKTQMTLVSDFNLRRAPSTSERRITARSFGKIPTLSHAQTTRSAPRLSPKKACFREFSAAAPVGGRSHLSGVLGSHRKSPATGCSSHNSAC
jgi:hypothetical protein